MPSQHPDMKDTYRVQCIYEILEVAKVIYGN